MVLRFANLAIKIFIDQKEKEMKLRTILLSLLIANFCIAQPLTYKIGKAKTNFVTVNPSSVTEPNLVFYYSGNSPISKKIIDASGNGNHGDLYGGVVYAGGISGGLQFDGVNDYVSVADADNLDFGTGDFSYEFNINITANASTTYIFQKQNSSPNYNGIALVKLGTNKLRVDFNDASTSTNLTTTQTLITGAYHILVVKSGTTISMYINGIYEPLTGTNNLTVSSNLSNTKSLFIASNYSAGLNSKMILYSAKFYNVALTEQQVKDKYNKIASKPYYIQDFSDLTTANYQRDFTKVSGAFTVVSSTPNYFNCTSSGSVFFTTRDNASNCYMTYDYYTTGAWTSKAGLVSALSTAEATMDYNATNRKLTFIMGTNDRVRNIKIIRGVIVQ